MEHTHPTSWWQPPTDAPGSPQWGGVTAEARPASPRAAFVALSAFTVVLVMAPQDLMPVLAPFRLALAALVAALAAILGNGAERARAFAIRAPEFATVLALLCWVLLTMPLSYWPGGSIATFSDRLLKSFIVFWLLGVTVTTLPRLRAMCWLLSALTMPIALTAIHHYLAGVWDPRAGDRILGYGLGLAGNPNDLALMLDIVLPLTLSLAVSAAHPTTRLLALAIAAVDAAAVVVTFSRGGFVAMAAILMLFLLRRLRQAPWSTTAFVLLALVVAVPFVPAGFVQRLSTVTDINSDVTGSAQDRWRDTKLAVQFVVSHPVIGVGLGNDILVLNEMRGPTWRSVHNSYLNYGVDLGVPGMALFVLLLIQSLRGARRARQRADSAGDRELAALAAGITVGLWGFAVAAFFYPVAYQFYFYYLAGLSVAAQRVETAVPPRMHAPAH